MRSHRVPRSLLVLPALIATLLSGPAAGASVLERDWCVGVSPISWGFTITPTEEAGEVRLRVLSTNVRLLSAAPGPGAPEGWTVELSSDTEVVARGDSPLAAGERRTSFFLIETDRSSQEVGSNGVLPVQWEVSFAGSGGESRTAPTRAAFPPVLELADAVSRGIVLCTVETHSPAGPVEVTVDNPTWEPLWLDLPPGTLLEAGGEQWVVALARPFRMMRKQKTGRTIRAFPLTPPPRMDGPSRRLRWSGRVHARSSDLAEIALATRLLEQRSIDGLRAAGPFESAQPFDFWPLVQQWAAWQALAQPQEGALVELVTHLLRERAAAGDRLASELDSTAAAREVAAASADALRLREEIRRSQRLSLPHRTARARFR